VGPKSAVSVLSVLGVSGVLAACAREDAAAFTQVPGIGKKLAQRIAMELPDRLRKVAIELSPAAGPGSDAPASAPESEAALALAALGFSRAEAQIAVSRSRKEIGGDPTAEALVRRALKQLSGPRR